MMIATQNFYFCPGMKRKVEAYIAKCQKCQQVKVEHQHLVGILQPWSILEWKWEDISMDFIIGFPMTARQNDSIMVAMENLSKEAHFILVKSTHKASDISKIFMKEIFRLLGFPMKTTVLD